MKITSKGYTGVDTPLFQTMLVQGQILQGEGSTIPVESHHTPTVAPSTSQPHHSPTLKDFIRQETEVPQPSSPTQTHVADEAASIGVDVRHGGAATTVSSLDADMAVLIGIDGAQTQRHDHEIEADFEFTTAEDVSTANVSVNTAGAKFSIAIPKVKNAGVSINDVAVEFLVYIRRSVAKRKDKGKAIMEESEPTQTKTKIQQEQERLGFEEALRLQEQFDEEERQRIASVHEEASTFKPEEWDNIQAQIEADEEFVHSSYTTTVEKNTTFDEINSSIEATEKEGKILFILQWRDMIMFPKVNSWKIKEECQKKNLVELKRLFEPVDDDELWKSHKKMHDPIDMEVI
ncbi:hypothetical protein Tco_0857032 [Tanacetum coccineum]|uniref:Uncharacterized protein n=1 Tax=Tanacetum coccineum TaxID=301880 RepID=A0ABQ5B519_9ASTR